MFGGTGVCMHTGLGPGRYVYVTIWSEQTKKAVQLDPVKGKALLSAVCFTQEGEIFVGQACAVCLCVVCGCSTWGRMLGIVREAAKDKAREEETAPYTVFQAKNFVARAFNEAEASPMHCSSDWSISLALRARYRACGVFRGVRTCGRTAPTSRRARWSRAATAARSSWAPGGGRR